MAKKQKRSLFDNYIRENKTRLIINICMLAAGAIGGSIVYLYSGNPSGFADEAEAYIRAMESLYTKQIFISSLKDAGIMCAGFFVCSLFYIGEFLCPGYMFLRSAALGFSACAVIGAFGMGKGIALLATLVPINMFYFTGAVIFSVETAKQSRFMAGGFDKRAKNRSFISYIITAILPLIFIFIGCVVESFCVPYLILWCLKKF